MNLMAFSLSARRQRQAPIYCVTDRLRPRTRTVTGVLSECLPAALLLVTGLVGLGVAWIVSGANSGQYLVVAPPGYSLADTIYLVRAADGGFVEPSHFRNIIIAGSNHPDFPAALRRAGAWLVVAAPARGGCVAPILEEGSL